jgi:hypothetical protein
MAHLFPSTSRLSHIITIYHIYIIIIGSNAHSNGLIEASIPRLHQFHTSHSKPSKATASTSRSLHWATDRKPSPSTRSNRSLHTLDYLDSYEIPPIASPPKLCSIHSVDLLTELSIGNRQFSRYSLFINHTAAISVSLRPSETVQR